MWEAQYSTDGGKTWIALRAYARREEAQRHAEAFRVGGSVPDDVKTRVVRATPDEHGNYNT